MEPQNQNAASRQVLSRLKIKKSLSTYNEVDRLLCEFHERTGITKLDTLFNILIELDALMERCDKVREKVDEEPELLSNILNDLRTLLQDTLVNSTNIEKYELAPKGIAQVNGDNVTINGQKMSLNMFHSVRYKKGTLTVITENVFIDGLQMTLNEYIAARAAHRGIPEPSD